jgi:nicotinamidase-related amidase
MDIGSTALIIIDVQKGFDDSFWGKRNNPGAEPNIARLLGAFREAGAKVVHVRHMSAEPTSPLRPGQPGNELKAEVRPRPGEAVVEKTVNSSFLGTVLEPLLDRAGIETVVIVGLTTSHCVSTTARMAGNLGYQTFVVSDATATFERKAPDGELIPAELMHRVALTEIHGEFATVVDTERVVGELLRSVR